MGTIPKGLVNGKGQCVVSPRIFCNGHDASVDAIPSLGGELNAQNPHMPVGHQLSVESVAWHHISVQQECRWIGRRCCGRFLASGCTRRRCHEEAGPHTVVSVVSGRYHQEWLLLVKEAVLVWHEGTDELWRVRHDLSVHTVPTLQLDLPLVKRVVVIRPQKRLVLL